MVLPIQTVNLSAWTFLVCPATSAAYPIQTPTSPPPPPPDSSTETPLQYMRILEATCTHQSKLHKNTGPENILSVQPNIQWPLFKLEQVIRCVTKETLKKTTKLETLLNSPFAVNLVSLHWGPALANSYNSKSIEPLVPTLALSLTGHQFSKERPYYINSL